MTYPPETPEDAARVDSILRTIAKKRINRNRIVASDKLLASLSRDGYIDSERVGSNDEYFLTEFGMYFLTHGGFYGALQEAEASSRQRKYEADMVEFGRRSANSAIASAVCAATALAITIMQFCCTN